MLYEGYIIYLIVALLVNAYMLACLVFLADPDATSRGSSADEDELSDDSEEEQQLDREALITRYHVSNSVTSHKVHVTSSMCLIRLCFVNCSKLSQSDNNYKIRTINSKTNLPSTSAGRKQTTDRKMTRTSQTRNNDTSNTWVCCYG